MKSEENFRSFFLYKTFELYTHICSFVAKQ